MLVPKINGWTQRSTVVPVSHCSLLPASLSLFFSLPALCLYLSISVSPLVPRHSSRGWPVFPLLRILARETQETTFPQEIGQKNPGRILIGLACVT